MTSVRKKLIAGLAAISGISAGLSVAGGLLSPLQAQCGGGGGGGGSYCERNACNSDTGNCELTSAAYNCRETPPILGAPASCTSDVCM